MPIAEIKAMLAKKSTLKLPCANSVNVSYTIIAPPKAATVKARMSLSASETNVRRIQFIIKTPSVSVMIRGLGRIIMNLASRCFRKSLVKADITITVRNNDRGELITTSRVIDVYSYTLTFVPIDLN